MKPGLSLRVSQHLALTPQLQQSIRLLQLSTLELAAEVEQMLDENPFLERAEPEGASEEEAAPALASPLLRADDHAAERAAPDSALADTHDVGLDEFGAESVAELGWDGDGSVEWDANDPEWGGDAPAHQAPDDDDRLQAGDRAQPVESLAEHLHAQALALRLAPEDAAVLGFLIESLDDDGYLRDSLAQLGTLLTEEDDDTEQLQEIVHRFTLALHLLQSMEPAGVGARDLPECLRLQLLARQAEAERHDGHVPRSMGIGLKLCAQPGVVELLARRDARRLAAACGEPEAAVREAMALIATLEPKPGRPFADVERNVIVPDVIVTRVGTGTQPRFRVQLNPDVMPRLRVHDIYANALRGARGSESHQALAQRLQEARWFIKNIQQRFDTILRVATLIVERQRAFFTHGELGMRPLVQRELADELGVHESTISRVTTAKYMATPQGTFELKYFFGSALGTEAGGNASSTAVRALIKQFIAAEDARKPLSDNQLSEMLREQGIDCARRTVAKYREALRIPVASLRRALPA